MKLFKYICLIIFAIITVLFTVGYTTQPIVNTSDPTGSANNTFYLSQNVDYSNVSSDAKIILQALFVLCIIITILLSIGIILSYIGVIGFKFISKIIFLLALILMIIVFAIIQIKIISNSIVVMANSKTVSTPTTSNGTGYYLILVSTILMFGNFILCMFLA